MASRRDIKKDINFLAEQMMAECFSFLRYSPLNELENVLEILHDIEQLRINLLFKVNNRPEEESPQEYYKKIIDELYKQNMELLEQLNSLSE